LLSAIFNENKTVSTDKKIMFLTQESPGKVLSLLGASLFSLFMLFGISATNASFSKTEFSLPDPFGPANVVSALDNFANSYSKFVEVYLVQPGQQSYAVYTDNLNFVIEEAGPSILAITGFDALVEVGSSTNQGEVAGAFEQVVVSELYPEESQIDFDRLYSLLLLEE